MNEYFKFIWDQVYTISVGLKLTTKYFFKSLGKPATLNYPDVKPVVSERYRGIHVLDKDVCIGCYQCARACPIDCIEINLERDKQTKKITYYEFSVDYNKCMFCHLCIEPCPVSCIDMSRTYEFNVKERENLVLDLLDDAHQYDCTTPEGVSKGRNTDFYEAFNNTVFNILNPGLQKKDFDDKGWSRKDRKFIRPSQPVAAKSEGGEAK